MSTLLDFSDYDLDEETVPPTTRQSRREQRRWKAKKNKANQQSAKRKPRSKKTKQKSNPGMALDSLKEQQDKDLWSVEVYSHVAAVIVQAAIDLERFVGERWYESRRDLINALARDHLVVHKRREQGSLASARESEIISSALSICELEEYLSLVVEDGKWLMVPLVDDPREAACSCETHRLRLTA